MVINARLKSIFIFPAVALTLVLLAVSVVSA